MTQPNPPPIDLHPGDSIIIVKPDGTVRTLLYSAGDGPSPSARLALVLLATVMWDCVHEHAAGCLEGTHGAPDHDIFGDSAHSKGTLQ